jgi:hypothetical protein
MYITNTTDTAMADPSTTNKTNDIASNTPFLALRKPLPPSNVYGIIPGSNEFHSDMLMGVGTEAKQTSGDARKSNFLELRQREVRRTLLFWCS